MNKVIFLLISLFTEKDKFKEIVMSKQIELIRIFP